MKTYDEIKASVVRENTWINIKNEVPHFDDLVIVDTGVGVTSARLRRIDSGGLHWDFNESNQIYWGTKIVTHWMPLPEPAKV